MGLVRCPDCNRDVSDAATACIHCGSPLATHNENRPCRQSGGEVLWFVEKPSAISGFMGILFGLFICLLGTGALWPLVLVSY